MVKLVSLATAETMSGYDRRTLSRAIEVGELRAMMMGRGRKSFVVVAHCEDAMKIKTDLLPCPFCGFQPSIGSTPVIPLEAYVWCRSCRFGFALAVRKDTEIPGLLAKLKVRWNTRYQPQTLDALNRRMLAL